MNQNLTKLYEGANASGATPNLIYVPILDARTLTQIKVKTDENVSGADAVFELKLNGAVITGAEAITITSGTKIGTVGSLSIALVEGDELVLNLLSGSVSSPVTLNLKTTKTVNTDELTEVTDKKFVTDAEKTKLAALSGSNSGDQTLNGLLPSQTGNSGKVLQTDGTNASWQTPSGGGSGFTDTQVAITGYDNLITTVSGRYAFTVMRAFTLNDIFASVRVVSSSGNLTIDVKLNGSSIFTTDKITIEASEYSSISAATPPNITTTAFAQGDIVTVDITAAGTGAIFGSLFFKHMIINPFSIESLDFPAARYIDYDPASDFYAAVADTNDVPVPYDLSGNGNHGAVGDASFKPRLSRANHLNGFPTFFFNNDATGFATGNQYYWTLPDLSAITAGGEAFAVLKYNFNPDSTNELGAGLWNFGTQAAPNAIPYKNSDGNIYDDFGSTVRKGFNAGGNANYNNQWFIYSAKSSSGDWQAYRNGSQITSIGTNTVAFTSAPTIGHSNVGSNYYFSGWLARFIFFTPALSDADSVAFANQLKAKYGL